MKTFLIKKGRHRVSGFHFGFNFDDEFSKTVVFTESCRYTLPEVNKHDINRLYGFSNGDHTENSACIGWRWNEDKELVDLVCLMLIDQETLSSEDYALDLLSVPIDAEINVSIELVENHYVLRATHNEITAIKKFEAESELPGYYLYPRFGEKIAAPQRIEIIFK